MNTMEDDHLLFQASNLYSMNDTSEYKLAEMQSTCVVDEIMANSELGHPFALCFSKKEDFIPMWQMYGDRGKGVCLKFDKSELETFFKKSSKEDIQYRFQECIYDICDKKRTEEKPWSEESKQMPSDLLERICEASFHKHESFSYEEEWRLMIWASYTLGGAKKIKFRTSPNIQPYMEVRIPSSSLKEIVTGPCVSDIEFQYLRDLLFVKHSQYNTFLHTSQATLKLKS